MSIHRLLDEAVLKGGYCDGYSMLDALMRSAGFVYKARSDGYRSTCWELPVSRGSPLLVYVCRTHGSLPWSAAIYRLASVAGKIWRAEATSPEAALSLAYDKAVLGGVKQTPRVRQFLDALTKLRASPLCDKVEPAVCAMGKVCEAVLKGGYDSTIDGWVARALRAAGLTRDDEVEDRWILDVGLVKYKLTIHRALPIYSVVVYGPRYSDKHSVYRDNIIDALADALRGARGYDAEYAAIKLRKFADAFPPPEDTSMLSED